MLQLFDLWMTMLGWHSRYVVSVDGSVRIVYSWRY